MQFGPDMPVPMNNNRVLKAVMAATPSDESPELLEYREQVRENELNLLGSMLFHALVVGASVLLYSKWEWSRFSGEYEAATFYALAAFFVQAGFYFMWRAAFEDSSSHRRRMRKMRLKNRKRIQGMRYTVEEAQQEAALKAQMYELEHLMTASMEDNVITSQEGNDIMAKMQNVLRLQALVEQNRGNTTPNTAPVIQSTPTATSSPVQQIPGQPSQTLQPQGAKGHVHNQL
jgi:hypothetical protein